MHVMNKHAIRVYPRIRNVSSKKVSPRVSHVPERPPCAGRRRPGPRPGRPRRPVGDRRTARAEARESRMCALSSCRVSYRFLNTQSTIALDLFSLSDLPLVACKLARFREGPRVTFPPNRGTAGRRFRGSIKLGQEPLHICSPCGERAVLTLLEGNACGEAPRDGGGKGSGGKSGGKGHTPSRQEHVWHRHS